MTAACANDPRFTSDDPFDRAEAAEVCGGCAVRERCLAGARARGEQWHVWGGRDFGAVELAEPVVWEPQVFAPVHNRAHYVAGCRAPECVAANTAYVAHWREEHRFAAPEVREPMPEQLDLFAAIGPVTRERKLMSVNESQIFTHPNGAAPMPGLVRRNHPMTADFDMTAAPAPSPAEQAVIDRFDAAEEPEEIRVERVALALYETDRDPAEFWRVRWENAYGTQDHYRDLARAAIAALEPPR